MALHNLDRVGIRDQAHKRADELSGGQQQLMKWSSVGMIVSIIAVVVWIMDIGSGKIRERIL